MQQTKRFRTGLGLTIGALLVLVGCAQKSPLEKLIENRARYKAKVNSFYIDAQPVIAEAIDAEPEAEGAEIEGEAAEPEPVAVVQNAHLDLLVQHDSSEKLPGVTLDIVQVDANKTQKGQWRTWVDTSKVERANPTSYSYVIEGIDYVEGDGFSAEVRHPIPEAERGEYREFENVGP